MVKMKSILGIAMLVLTGTTTVATAVPFTMDGKTVDLESWTVNLPSWSASVSQTVLVLDYNHVETNSGNGGTGNDAYYFGYIWDGSAKTVWDMMADIEAAESTLTFYKSNFGSEENPSYFVNGWAYGANDYTADWNNNNEWVKEWLSTDGSAWTDGGGVSSDAIVDGNWTGLIFQYGGSNDPPHLPEPASMSLLGLGGLALLRRKRRN
jgi:hypothetical protein